VKVMLRRSRQSLKCQLMNSPSISHNPAFFSSQAQNTRTGIWFFSSVPFLVVLRPFSRFFRRSSLCSHSTQVRLDKGHQPFPADETEKGPELYQDRFDLIVIVPGVGPLPPFPACNADIDVSAADEAELCAFPAEFENRVLAVSANERQILVKDFSFSGPIGLPVPGSELSDNFFFSAMVNPTCCLQAL
jgi:hypothetical protein